MTTLHLIRESAFARSINHNVKLVSPNDTLVLLDDGCYNIRHEFISTLANYNIVMIKEHAIARGLNEHPYKSISANQLPELIFTHENNITW